MLTRETLATSADSNAPMALLTRSAQFRMGALIHQLKSVIVPYKYATSTESRLPVAMSKAASPSTTQLLVTPAWPTQSPLTATACPWRATIGRGGWRATLYRLAHAIPARRRSSPTGTACSERRRTARFYPYAPLCPTAPVVAALPPSGLSSLRLCSRHTTFFAPRLAPSDLSYESRRLSDAGRAFPLAPTTAPLIRWKLSVLANRNASTSRDLYR